MTTTFDASVLSTLPATLPTLPTGTFALPISAPSTVQNSCLVNTQQSNAWSCNVPMTSYTITVSGIPGANVLDDNEVNLSLGNNSFGGYYPYGTQPPLLTQTQVLSLVVDSQAPSRGPAWFFELPYNKVVIVPEDQLSVFSSSKRGISERGQPSLPSSFMRKSVAQVGDKPWFCYWNGTLLEAFIYVNLTSSGAASSSTAATTTTRSSTGTYGSSAATGSAQSTSSSSSGSSNEEVNWPPAYPKVLKIEERRIPGAQAIPPYCKIFPFVEQCKY